MSADQDSKWPELAIIAGLCGISLVTFWPVLAAGFLLNDDPLNITGVPQIRELGVANLKWMFFDFGPDIRYKPITYLSWAIIHAVGGMKPLLFHLANLALHCVNVCLLFRLSLRMGELIAGQPVDADARHFRLIAAGVLALFWAVHPLRVETVAWLSVFSYSLTACFLQLAMLNFLACDMNLPLLRQRRYWVALGLFQLGMMSFPTAIGFCFAFLAVRIYPLRQINVDSWSGILALPSRRAWMEMIPFFVLSVGMIGVGLYGQFVVQGIWGEPRTLEELPLWLRVLGSFYYLAYYSWRPFYPVKHFTLNDDLVGVAATDGRLLIAVLLVVGAAAWAFAGRRKRPAGLAFGLAFVGALAPVMNFSGGTPLPSDRYSLLPGILQSVALFGMVISLRSRRQRNCLMIGFVVYSVAVAEVSRQRSHVWKDDLSFFSDRVENIRHTGYLVHAHRILGELAVDSGDDAKGLQHWNAAWGLDRDLCVETIGEEYAELLIDHNLWADATAVLERLRKLNEDDFLASLKLAYVWLRLGERAKAEAAVEKVVASDAYANAPIGDYLFEVPLTKELPTLIDLVGRAHLRRAEMEEAVEIYEIFVAGSPNSTEPFLISVAAFLAAEAQDTAAKFIQRGLTRFPGNPQLVELQRSLH